MTSIIEWHKITTRLPTNQEIEWYEEHEEDVPEYIFDCEMPEDGEEILISTKWGGSWVHKNSVLFKDQVFCFPDQDYEFSVAICFTEDFSAWDDFNNVLVLGEEFCQPYVAFYGDNYKKDITGFHALEYCISQYNKFMDSFDFLETDYRGKEGNETTCGKAES